jgi:hypothetical protein
LALAAFGCNRDHQVNHLPPQNPRCPSGEPALALAAFHGDRARTGWNAQETHLTPANVGSAAFNWIWDSEPFDSVVVGGKTYPPRLYASPLYMDAVSIQGTPASVVFAASSTAFVYAVNACDQSINGQDTAAGKILWRARLNTAAPVAIDGGVTLGVLSTPFIDTQSNPPRLYVASLDAAAGWQVFALDITNGQVLPGWPAAITPDTLNAVNANGPALFRDATIMTQRAALNLSPAGDFVYAGFGTTDDSAPGWMVAIDTRTAKVAAAFAGAPSVATTSQGGMWAPGGPAIDAMGNVYSTTGNGDPGPMPGYWSESLLRFKPPLALSGTYTPFNYCTLDMNDIDVGGDSPVLIPDQNLLAFGSKQGNVYLLARDRLPGSLTARPLCSTDSSSDGSLLPPDAQPQFGARGPLNVFGPYSDMFGNLDYAKMRSTPAYYKDAAGKPFLFASGATKKAADSNQSVPPSVAKLEVVLGANPFLRIDSTEKTITFLNPGSPTVSSNGSNDAIVWILDQNAGRQSSIVDPNVNNPVLYAVDATTMTKLFQSAQDLVNLGSKYSVPAVAHGFVFVGSDRIQAFGLRN